MKKQTNKETNTSSSKISEKEKDVTSSSKIRQDNLFEDSDLPGYPHYPNKEDIMNPGNDMEKIELSEEKFSHETISADKKRGASKKDENKSSEPDLAAEEDADIASEEEDDETSITREDLIALDDDAFNPEEGDDAQLRKRSVPLDMSGDDLDVPGSELDDEEEMIGEEDEENNSYSIGGDRHDDLEENGADEEERI